MRNIPFFTTEFGVASLTLNQIPYTGRAYFRIQNAAEPSALIQECLNFCKAAGADTVYATGHHQLSQYLYHTQIWKMQCLRKLIPQTNAILMQVDSENLQDWVTIYNQKMNYIPNASYMTEGDARKLQEKGGMYFVMQDELLGIGAVNNDCIEALAGVVPGSGKALVGALNQAITGEYVSVEVASENRAAVKLYEKLGFVRKEIIAQWYKIL